MIKKWLQKMSPSDVIESYNHLNDKLPTKNGWISETNETLANITGGSTNVIILDIAKQSKGVLFYVALYVCKTKVALEQYLNVFKNVQEHIKKYPSRADDTGTTKRTVQNMFTRVMNTLHSHIEVSDTQAAVILLNMNMEVTSETFAYFGADHSVNYLTYELNQHNDNNTSLFCKNQVDQSCNGSKSKKSDDENSISNSSFLEGLNVQTCDPSNALLQNSSGDKSFGPAPFWKIKHNIQSEDTDDEEKETTVSVPIHYPLHFRLRGKELKMMTQHEYFALIKINPIQKEDEIDDASDNNDDETDENDSNHGNNDDSDECNNHKNDSTTGEEKEARFSNLITNILCIKHTAKF